MSSFGNQVAPFELPIGAEHEFQGIADLLHEKADLYPSGPNAEESEWPDEIHQMADPAREKLIEAVAESDDALIEKYLDEGTLPEARHHPRREGRVRQRPARAGPRRLRVQGDRDRPAAGLHRRGVPLADRARPDHRDREGRRGEGARRAIPTGPLTAFVFKTVSDPFVGHITMFRVFSGKVRPDSTVHDATQGADERIGQLFALKGKEHETLAEVTAGDIGAVAKLQHTHTGDTFSTKDDPVQLAAGRAPRAAARVRDQPRRPRATRTSSPPASHASARRTRRSASRATTRPTRR